MTLNAVPLFTCLLKLPALSCAGDHYDILELTPALPRDGGVVFALLQGLKDVFLAKAPVEKLRFGGHVIRIFV